MIKEYAYAKVNLYLLVKGEKDGYHELETLMVKTSLCDILSFKKRKDDNIEIKGLNIENNSILLAAKMFKEKYHTSGITISVKKNIPMEAGLGGTSADSSATLRGLNQLFNLNLSLDDLNQMAKSLGSDNSFCLYNKAAICYGRGEILDFIDMKFKLNALLIKPSYGIKTKEAFKLIKEKDNIIDQEILIKAIKDNDYEKINQMLINDLLEPALILEPKLKTLIDKIESLGFKAHMSGSGSTLFVLNKDINKLKKLSKILDNDNDFYLVELIED